MKIYFLILNP